MNTRTSFPTWKRRSRFYDSRGPPANGKFASYDRNDLYSSSAESWKFESYDFPTTPATNDKCADGLIPVYRAYNNGFAHGIDSNHRITSDFSAYQQTIARGWVAEGVAMCTPQ